MGDPTATKLVEEECRHNGGYRGIDSIVVCNIVREGEYPEVESTQEECDKCSRKVWVSYGTKADAAATAEQEGGSVVFLCFVCLPNSIMSDGIRLGDAQKIELRIAGADVEEVMKYTGLTLDDLAKIMLSRGIARDKEGGPGGRVQN
jgi:hypothetical protein